LLYLSLYIYNEGYAIVRLHGFRRVPSIATEEILLVTRDLRTTHSHRMRETQERRPETDKARLGTIERLRSYLRCMPLPPQCRRGREFEHTHKTEVCDSPENPSHSVGGLLLLLLLLLPLLRCAFSELSHASGFLRSQPHPQSTRENTDWDG
jgi:hypothetical protein